MQVTLLHHLRRNAVAYLALFVALGGTSFAAATLITGKNVKNGSLTGADVKNSSLTGTDVKNSSLTGTDVKNKSLGPGDFNGSVAGPKGDTGPPGPAGPSTGPAGGALTGSYPNPLLAAGAVNTAAFAASATAPNADKLDGMDSADFLAAPGEGWHFVGEAGEPSFLTANDAPNLDGDCGGGANSWANYGDGYTRAAFFRDSIGMVHLSGVVKGGQFQCAIFQLPAGYRPEERTILPVLVDPDVLGRVDIAQAGVGGVSGVVRPKTASGTNSYVSLAGISFPCGPSGQDGCP